MFQSLGLCTATVMFALSQDRLNMDLDRDSLELMLNLLESDASHLNALEDCGLSSSQLLKNKQKVRELCAEIQSQGHAKHLNLDNITVSITQRPTLSSFEILCILIIFVNLQNTGWSVSYGNPIITHITSCWRVVQRRIERIRWPGTHCKNNLPMLCSN